ncbi:MAG: DUF1573 domain-containing protein [Deltaproteobacteria bacterium]|jgi:hypothetical protein|nr:DUF1573 domain-containing protein [Deltaproteobacteria bacterium]
MLHDQLPVQHFRPPAVPLVVLLIWLSLPAWAAQAALKAGPALVIDEPVFMAGRVAPDAVVEHDFVVRNEGTEELVIEDVSPDCGCTVAAFPPVLAPGQAGTINVKLEIYEFWAGQTLKKSATVYTNDPERQAARITIKAVVDER